MPAIEEKSTQNTITELLSRQGGGLFLEREELLDVDYQTWLVAASIPYNFKPFSISIYNSSQNEDVVTLVLMINPKDLNIGQTFVSNNTYTRVGWVTSFWGRQQMTLTFSGSSPGFYIMSPEGSGGLTNYNRRGSAGFYNFMSLVGLFKNNAYYFLNNLSSTIYKDGFSRVINVMDCIKVEYDGSTYLGSFSTLSITDSADKPYRIEYNMEFVVSSIGADLEALEGHVRNGDNYLNNDVTIAVQGDKAFTNKRFELSEEELNSYYNIDELKDILSTDDPSNSSGANSGAFQPGTYSGSIPRVNPTEFLSRPENQGLKAELEAQAKHYGVPFEELVGEILFETDGTMSNKIINKKSGAYGYIQMTAIACKQIAPRLVKEGLIDNETQCQTSNQYAAICGDDKVKQAKMIQIYYEETKVYGTGKSVAYFIQNASTFKEKQEAIRLGVFFPDAITWKDKDKEFPQWVQDANPGIKTPNDYLRSVDNKISYMKRMDATKLTIQETPQPTKTEGKASGGSH